MKKIVGLSLALIMVIGMIVVETFANFTDTETSSGNQLVAGTLDLKTNDADGVSQTLYATNMSPGDTVGPSTIILKNDGAANGATLDIGFSYAESDGSPNNVNKTADEVAAIIEVTTLSHDVTNLLTSVADSNGNGYKDIQDVKNTSFSGLSGMTGGASKNFVITVKMRDGISNDFQIDGITITMTFTLKQ